MGLSKAKWGVKQQKKKTLPTSISRDVLRVGWVIASVLVAVVHAVLVAAVRVAVGGRCRARRRRGSSLVAGVGGSEVVAGCRGRGSSRCVGASRSRVAAASAIFRLAATSAMAAMAMAAAMAPPSQTRNATAIRWRFFRKPQRNSAMAPPWPPFNNTALGDKFLC